MCARGCPLGTHDGRLESVAREMVKQGVSARLAHFGEDYVSSDEPQALRLRKRSSTFTWLAYSIDPISMWDLHVGLVLDGDRVLTGLHVAATAEPELVEVVRGVGAGIGSADYSEGAAEIQFNRSPEPSIDDPAGIATFMADLYRAIEREITDSELLAPSPKERH